MTYNVFGGTLNLALSIYDENAVRKLELYVLCLRYEHFHSHLRLYFDFLTYTSNVNTQSCHSSAQHIVPICFRQRLSYVQSVSLLYCYVSVFDI